MGCVGTGAAMPGDPTRQAGGVRGVTAAARCCDRRRLSGTLLRDSRRDSGGPGDADRGPGGIESLEKRRQRKKGKPRDPRIRCPLCKWQPRKSSRWACDCGHAWNTFDTAGLCPGCGKQWLDTICLACHGWSKHRDWYGAGE